MKFVSNYLLSHLRELRICAIAAFMRAFERKRANKN
jgi:hypothetical protein